jgi:hypothetical protein
MSHKHRHGGALAAILLTALILGALTVAALVSRRGEATVETPFGDVRVRESAAFDPKRMGLSVYPGAVRRRDRHKLASVHLDFGTAECSWS